MDINENTEFEDFNLSDSYEDYAYKSDLKDGILTKKKKIVIENDQNKKDMQVIFSYKYPKFLKYNIGLVNLDLNVKSEEYTGFYLIILQNKIQNIIYINALKYPDKILIRDIIHEIKNILDHTEQDIISKLKS